MVKKIESYQCSICGILHHSREEAIECERIHKEGIIIKEYLHNNANCDEIKECQKDRGILIDNIQVELISNLLYEVEIDIKLMDDYAEIIDIKKEKTSIKENK